MRLKRNASCKRAKAGGPSALFFFLPAAKPDAQLAFASGMARASFNGREVTCRLPDASWGI